MPCLNNKSYFIDTIILHSTILLILNENIQQVMSKLLSYTKIYINGVLVNILLQ